MSAAGPPQGANCARSAGVRRHIGAAPRASRGTPMSATSVQDPRASSRSPSAAPSKERLRALCGSTVSGSRSPATTSASARTSTRTSRCWAPASRRCEVDLMQPLDPAKKPAVHEPPLNHVGLWVDDLPRGGRVAHGAGRALRARRHPQGRIGLRHHVHPPQGQRRRADRRRRGADRAGAGAAGGRRRVWRSEFVTSSPGVERERNPGGRGHDCPGFARSTRHRRTRCRSSPPASTH